MERRETRPEERSPSARYFVLGFLALVALCAVFFSLGFLIGYNQRASKQEPVAENVSAPSEIPPTVNPPAQSPASASKEDATNSSTHAGGPPPETPKKLGASSTQAKSSASSREHRAVSRPGPKRTSKAAASAPAEPAGHAGAGYSIQVMAARTQKDAKSLADLLKTRGYPAFVLEPQTIGASDNYFRVLVGPYTSRAAAEKVLKQLEKEGFKPFIKH